MANSDNKNKGGIDMLKKRLVVLLVMLMLISVVVPAMAFAGTDSPAAGPIEPPDEDLYVTVNGHTFNADLSTNWVGDGLYNNRTRVIDLQAALTHLGFNPGPIDGYWGPKTKAALKSFQSWAGISVDGSCGPMTWGTINYYY